MHFHMDLRFNSNNNNTCTQIICSNQWWLSWPYRGLVAGSAVFVRQMGIGQRCWWAHRTRWAGLWCRSSTRLVAAPCSDLWATSTQWEAEKGGKPSYHYNHTSFSHADFVVTWHCSHYLLLQTFEDLCDRTLHEESHCIPLDHRWRQQGAQALSSLS